MKIQNFLTLLVLLFFTPVKQMINLQNYMRFAPANAITQVNKSPVGRIIEADGKVFLKRQNWSEYYPAFVGTELYATDKIKLTSQANLMAICYANWKTWSVPKNTISQTMDGCLQAKSQCVETPDGCVPLDATRGINQVAITDKIPYLISPRHTLLLPDKPLILRWNPVAGSTRYTVRIKSPSEYIWETEVSENQVIYSGELPLKTGVRYTVIVHADTEVSSLDEKSPFSKQDYLGIGFALISQSQQQEIFAKSEELTQKLDGEARVLSIAELYQQNSLNGEAIAILESFVESGNYTAAIYQMLGEIYQQIQLPELAKDYYLESAKLTGVDDVAGSAKVEAALGEVYATLGSKEEAIRWLKLAFNKYEKLGEFQRGDEVKLSLEKLQQQLAEE
ncbi:MAG: tetratricopeptide repeat protein [Okeania sp. SIO3I5]|uniref:tetratricopeptide repeat protein n=1 Tax=Okeania sp. SIO3I5 TaxID=2607805 RepID=UPI0013B9E6AA|nr:tetratricopeptide repeat protein [Okeania sp. SIO3I5]NEQ39348.1 tetratricopeptide repeat protein [Okeania sp. SIO3I5]